MERKKKALKWCYRCLFGEGNRSRSQPQHLNNASISEPSLTVLNATEKLLEMTSPIDFGSPFDFIPDVPDVRSDPYTEDSEIRSAEDAHHDVRKVLPVITDSILSQASNSTKSPKIKR